MIEKFAIIALFAVIFTPLYALETPTGSAQVDVGGVTVEVPYAAEGVEVKSVVADLDGIELIWEVEVTGSPGFLEIYFDRQFFDAQFGDEDDVFFAIADGFDEVPLQETQTTGESRTILMELTPGSEEIEIFGTVLQGVEFEMKPTEPEPTETEPEPTETEPEPTETETKEEPKVETPKETVSETQCGPGTTLKNGVCVLDETCGPGTHLENGVCVLDETTSVGVSISDRPQGTQLVISTVAAFLIAFAVIIILWIIARGRGKKKQFQ